MITLKLKVLTQIYATHHLVCCKLLGCTGLEDFTLIEQVGAVGNGEGLIDIVVGDNYADILLLKGCHDALNILNGDRIHTRKRLVKEDKRRIDGNSSSNLCTATLTTRELITEAFAHFLQSELLDKFLKAMTLILLCVVCNLQHRADIILNAQATEDRCLLCEVAHTQLCTLIYGQLCKFIDRSVVVLEEYSAAIRFDKTHNHIERGGLTRTIWTEQTHNLALTNIDRDMVHDGTRFIFFDQIGSV